MNPNRNVNPPANPFLSSAIVLVLFMAAIGVALYFNPGLLPGAPVRSVAADDLMAGTPIKAEGAHAELLQTQMAHGRDPDREQVLRATITAMDLQPSASAAIGSLNVPAPASGCQIYDITYGNPLYFRFDFPEPVRLWWYSGASVSLNGGATSFLLRSYEYPDSGVIWQGTAYFEAVPYDIEPINAQTAQFIACPVT